MESRLVFWKKRLSLSPDNRGTDQDNPEFAVFRLDHAIKTIQERSVRTTEKPVPNPMPISTDFLCEPVHHFSSPTQIYLKSDSE